MQNAALRSKVFRFASFSLIDPAMRRTHSVANRPGARRGVIRRVDWRPLIAIVLLAGLLGFYAYQHWTAKPEAPLIGTEAAPQ